MIKHDEHTFGGNAQHTSALTGALTYLHMRFEMVYLCAPLIIFLAFPE